MQSLTESRTGVLPSTVAPMICPVCGSAMYPTDRNNFEVTYRCSSPEARFWDFDRGTLDQKVSKEHWDRSLREVFLNRG
jgi:Zn-finger nucleic acid-binding protein